MSRVGRPPSCLCGECARCKQRRYQREWWNRLTPEQRRAKVAARDSEKVRENERRRQARHRDRRNAERASRPTKRDRASYREYERANPQKIRARKAVARALKSGRLARQLCERAIEGTCSGPAQAHHDDYSRPLEVRWLCPRHHGEEHAPHLREAA